MNLGPWIQKDKPVPGKRKIATLSGTTYLEYDGNNFAPLKTTDLTQRLMICVSKDNSCRIYEIDQSAELISESNVFILETEAKIIVWEGSNSSGFEKGLATSYIQSMRRYDRHCKVEIYFSKEDPQIEVEFWRILGGKPTVIPNECARTNFIDRLYRVKPEPNE